MSFNLSDLSDSLAAAVDAASGAIVRVDARHHRGASGVVFAADGVIVTANHAVQRDEQIAVTLADGRTLEATLVGRDPGTDLAVLKVPAAGLAAPTWVETEGLKVGHVALALGRPGKTVRAALGVVGAFGEGYRTPFGGKLERYVQLDRDLPAGFSGGPALDARGRVLGVATSGLLRGVNIVVPTVTVRRVVSELQAHGRVPRGYLGVGVYPVRFSATQEAQFGQKFGVLLVSIESGSPADKAGLLLGDVLLTLDGQALERPGDLAALLGERVGNELTARVVRANAVQELKVTPAQRE